MTGAKPSLLMYVHAHEHKEDVYKSSMVRGVLLNKSLAFKPARAFKVGGR